MYIHDVNNKDQTFYVLKTQEFKSKKNAEKAGKIFDEKITSSSPDKLKWWVVEK